MIAPLQGVDENGQTGGEATYSSLLPAGARSPAIRLESYQEDTVS
jgi:hypothetical protein